MSGVIGGREIISGDTGQNVGRHEYGDYYRGRRTVGATFEDREDAQRGINALRDAAFPSADIGAVAGRLADALVGLGVPEEGARHVEQGFRQGRALVTIDAGSDRAAYAAHLLRAFGGDIGRAAPRSATATVTEAESPQAR